MRKANSSLWNRVLRHSIFQNALALYGVQAANLLLPLIAIPYVARTLQPDAWGQVVFAQSFAIWATIIVEYGFIFSATRDVARYRNDPVVIQHIVANVLGAKLALVAVMTLISFGAFALIAVFQDRPQMLLWAWLLALGQGMSSLWYFQGVEQIRLAAGLEVIGRLLGVLGIFVLVRTPNDAPIVIALQAIAAITSSLALFALMHQKVAFERPSRAGTFRMLRAGFSMFFYRLCVSFYTSANALILGVLTTPAQVGYYGGAERIVTAANAVYWPVWRATYPRISYNLEHDRPEAIRLARLSFFLVSGYGIAIALVIGLLTPVFVPVFLGSGYEPAIPVLQILATIIPFVGVSGSLGLQWMVPNGLEKQFIVFTLLTAVINVIASLIFVPVMLAQGMAISVLISEAFVALVIIIYLLRKMNDFFKKP